jgi:hypothetical protein
MWPSNATRDEVNRWNPLGGGLGSTPSHAVVKGPRMHLPFLSKWSLGERTGFPGHGGLMCNM